MTARLRELAEDWRTRASNLTVDPRDKRRCAIGQSYRDCAEELIAIFDAEGNDGAVTELVRTSPEQIYLQISDDESDHEEAFPADHGDEITWCADSVLDCEVKYIRSDLVTRHGPTRSGGVSDADVEECIEIWNASPSLGREEDDAIAMRAALTHFAKGERHE